MDAKEFMCIFLAECPTLNNLIPDTLSSTIDEKVIYEKVIAELRNLSERFELKEGDNGKKFIPLEYKNGKLSDVSKKRLQKGVFEDLQTNINNNLQYDFLARKV